MNETLLFRKKGTLFTETVLREGFPLPAARLYKDWNELEARLRGLGVTLERIENLKSYFEAGEDTVLIGLP